MPRNNRHKDVVEGKIAAAFLEDEKCNSKADLEGKIPYKIDEKTTIWRRPGLDIKTLRENYKMSESYKGQRKMNKYVI